MSSNAMVNEVARLAIGPRSVQLPNECYFKPTTVQEKLAP